MGSLFKYKCYKAGYTELVLKKYLLLKKLLFWKSGCLEEIPALKNTCSEQLLNLKK